MLSNTWRAPNIHQLYKLYNDINDDDNDNDDTILRFTYYMYLTKT